MSSSSRFSSALPAAASPSSDDDDEAEEEEEDGAGEGEAGVSDAVERERVGPFSFPCSCGGGGGLGCLPVPPLLRGGEPATEEAVEGAVDGERSHALEAASVMAVSTSSGVPIMR
jgi:hypothetical protein